MKIETMGRKVTFFDSIRTKTRTNIPEELEYYMTNKGCKFTAHQKVNNATVAQMQKKYTTFPDILEILQQLTDCQSPVKSEDEKLKTKFNEQICWRIKIETALPHQEDSFNCGAFLCYFFFCVTENIHMEAERLRQEELLNWRKRMFVKIHLERQKQTESQSEDDFCEII